MTSNYNTIESSSEYIYKPIPKNCEYNAVESVYLLCTIGIPIHIAAIINSFAFNEIYFVKHKKMVKQIENKIKNGCHFTLRDTIYERRWVYCLMDLAKIDSGIETTSETQYQISFCVKCGNYIDFIYTPEFTRSIQCRCVYSEDDIIQTFKEDDYDQDYEDDDYEEDDEYDYDYIDYDF